MTRAEVVAILAATLSLRKYASASGLGMDYCSPRRAVSDAKEILAAAEAALAAEPAPDDAAEKLAQAVECVLETRIAAKDGGGWWVSELGPAEDALAAYRAAHPAGKAAAVSVEEVQR